MQKRLQKLYDGVHELLCISPLPHMCSEEENAVYSDLANLKLKLSDLIQKEKKYIKVWYSWGDEEPIIEVPEEEDPWEYMKKLVIKEAEVSFSEHEDEGEIGLQFFKDEGKIILHYPYDNSYCYYLICGR